ncbi:MAG TPA: aminotransferase class V-fold PLP-dependent enzyme [Pseudonocardiaceae bacterium]|nr:aminotransferase class V-fold PLP-dependent enzyme [Pseudonocardiaceae bacterium]
MLDLELAGGRQGADALGALVPVVLDALRSRARGGPAPAGGPAAVAASMAQLGDLLPPRGSGSAALGELAEAFVVGSVDPAHPWCAAHLHCPPLAVTAAADLLISALNPSMDSWDQAPIASEVERAVTGEFARLCFPSAAAPDALITSGGTESNLLGLLLARERLGPAVRPVCGANAHHSVRRAAWQLGLPEPEPVAFPGELGQALRRGPSVVVATAGSTDTGEIDPLPEIAEIARRHGAWLHIDAAYGGAALYSQRLRPLLAGLEAADSVALDLHKLGWQPIASGALAVAAEESLRPLAFSADYLNADDDTAAGMPDLLGRSLHTSRRADAFRIAVGLRALGRDGMAEWVERCCATAAEVAQHVGAHPALRLWRRPTLSTVLVRPVLADRVAAEHGTFAGNDLVARVRRHLLADGLAVVGRARVDGSLWLKLTLLHPQAKPADYLPLLDLIAARAPLRAAVAP